MSKIGKTPVEIPTGVTVTQKENMLVVTGSKGTLETPISVGIKVEISDTSAQVLLESDEVENGKAYWGLTRALLNSAIIGVSKGYSKELELVGVGYRVEQTGKNIRLFVGYSHDVDVAAPEGIEFTLEGNTEIKVAGIDKQLVGQTAAEIRAIRKPEPYKGKGIKYKDEVVRRKQGKAAKAAA